MTPGKTLPRGEANSVFGLSEAQLRPIVEAAVGESVASFDISIEHEVEGYYGFAAEKAIPTFSYVTSAGRRGRITVFAKHSHNPKSEEPEQYRFLAAHHAPIPRIYGVLRSPDDRPVLFLEYVDASHPARSIRSLEGMQEFLSLMARFNAIRPSREYGAWLEGLPGRWGNDAAEPERTREAIWKHAQEGELGDELEQFCSQRQAELPRLQEFARHILGQVAEMETGLVHTDFSVENTGRRDTGERVLMDLEPVTIGPRFFDASLLLGLPKDRWRFGHDQREMAEHYLSEYARRGGTRPPVDQFVQEVRVLWTHWIIETLAWGFGRGREGSPADDEERAACRLGLLRNLTMLLDRYC